MDEQITTHAPPKESKHQLERQFAVFSLMWALGSLLMVWQRIETLRADSVLLYVDSGIAITAFAVLIRTVWSYSFVMLNLFHVVHGLIQMPYVTTTELLWMFFGFVVCTSFVSSWLANRSHGVTVVGLYRSFAPCLRIMFVTALIASGMARMNWGFIRLETSPVGAALDHFRGELAPDWVALLTISALLIVDVFLALALLIPSLRRFCVGFGSCYFSWQALIGFGEARLMLPLALASLCLFTSTELTVRIHQWYGRWIPNAMVRSASVPVATALVAMALLVLSSDGGGVSSQLNRQRLVTWFFVTLVLIWTLSLLFALIDQRSRLTWVSLTPRNPLHYVLFCLFLFTAASPYLGTGTWGRFSDFSGLITERERNNHLFIPQSCLVHDQSDLIQIVASDDPYLRNIADNGLLITWFELVNVVNQSPECSLTYHRGDRRIHVPKTGENAEFSTGNSWLARKLMAFRPLRQPMVQDNQRRQVADH